MSIKICHASIDERGRISGGVPGDQTGREVCVRSWYNKPWQYYMECTDQALGSRAAHLFLEICNSNRCGYDQSNRMTLYEALKANDGKVEGMAYCEADCSSAVATIYHILGLDVNPACTTRNLRPALAATGKFQVYTDQAHISSDAYARRGGLYLKEGSHVVMAVEDGSAYSSDTPGLDGAASAAPPASGSTTSGDSSVSPNAIPSNIQAVQTWLNTCHGAGLTVDGLYGPRTRAALIRAWQTQAGGLEVDGIFGPECRAKAAKTLLRRGSKGPLVMIWQACLLCQGYNPKGIDSIFGPGCHTATLAFQNNHGLTPDGIVGRNTWTAVF